MGTGSAPMGRLASRLRVTPQRSAILDVLRATKSHPDASWVHQEVRKRVPHISLGTVYRNLSTLAEAGLICRIVVGQVSHWDGCTIPHDHAVCVYCGEIVDLELPELAAQLDSAAAAGSGFHIEGHRLQFVGLCPRCAVRSSP